jgi:dihydroxy-acid dehydratase
MTAIAAPAGIRIDLHRLNELSDSMPVLVNLKPTGPFYMQDLHAAGDIGAVLKNHRLDLLVDDEELRGRPAPGDPPLPARGYERFYREQILQADEGCDFRLLSDVPRADTPA